MSEDLSDLRPPAFPEVSYATWRERVERDLGVGAFEGLGIDSLAGIHVEPLYSADHPVAEPSPPVVGTGGWETWVRVEPGGLAPLPRELARGVRGLWMSPERAGVFHLVAAMVAQHDLAIGLESREDGLAAAALAVAALEGAEVPPETVRGSLGIDPLGVLARAGCLEAGLERALADMALVVAWCHQHASGLRAVRVSTVPYHDAGASAIEEIAFAVATGVDYVRALEAAGVPLAQSVRAVEFSFAVDRGFYVQVAKLRAFRRLWAGVGGLLSEEGGPPWIAAETSRRSATTDDPWTNLLRTTMETMAAVVGGADTVTTAPHDRALGIESERSRRLATGVQLILREEAHLGRVMDPAAGSWMVEELTGQLVSGAWRELQAIEADGGMKAALLGGRIGSTVRSSKGRRADAVTQGELPILGTTVFRPQEARPPVVPTANVTVETDRSGALADEDRCRVALARVGAVPPEGRFEAAIVAIQSGATLGELGRARASGGPTDIDRLVPVRDAAAVSEGARR